MRSASLSRDRKALGGKSVLVTAKGILNRLPSELTATLPMGADGAAVRAIRVVRLSAATGGAEIAGCLGRGGAPQVSRRLSGGAFTGFGVARALGGATDCCGRRRRAGAVLDGFRFNSWDRGAVGALQRAVGFGAAGTREATFGGSINFDGGTAAGRTLGVSARRMGFSTLVSRFSRVIEAGAGGDTARVGAKAGGTIGWLVTLRD